MGIDHGGLQAGVTELRLDRANVEPGLQKMGREGMAEGVGSDPLRDTSLAHGEIQRLLQLGFMHMRTPLLTGLFNQRQALLGEEPLMCQFLWRLRELLFHCIIQKHTIVSFFQILFMKGHDPLHLLLQFVPYRLRQRHGPVLLSLPMYRQHTCIEIEIPHSQLQTFEQPQSAAEQEFHDQVVRAVQMDNNGINLFPGQHHRDIQGLLRPRYVAQVS